MTTGRTTRTLFGLVRRLAVVAADLVARAVTAMVLTILGGTGV